MSVVKQKRSVESWGAAIDISIGEVETEKDLRYCDTVLIPKSSFNSRTVYYIEGQIERQAYGQTISVRLITDDLENGPYIQLGYLEIPSIASISSGEIIGTEAFSLCFKPSSGEYTKVLLTLLNRSFTEDKCELSDVPNCYQINNLITAEEESITQLGLQSKPGFKFVIDGEEMEVGRTGIYELPYKDYTINYLGIINPNNDWFIIDYRSKGGK